MVFEVLPNCPSTWVWDKVFTEDGISYGSDPMNDCNNDNDNSNVNTKLISILENSLVVSICCPSRPILKISVTISSVSRVQGSLLNKQQMR